MNKKFLFCIVSVLLVTLLAASSLFMVSAAGDPEVPEYTAETGATFSTDESIPDETGSTEPAELVKLVGDVDGSGVVDINDATAYQLTLAGRQSVTPAFELNGNTVTDGKMNIIDVTGIQYYVAKVFKKLPVTLDGYYSEIIRP